MTGAGTESGKRLLIHHSSSVREKHPDFQAPPQGSIIAALLSRISSGGASTEHLPPRSLQRRIHRQGRHREAGRFGPVPLAEDSAHRDRLLAKTTFAIESTPRSTGQPRILVDSAVSASLFTTAQPVRRTGGIATSTSRAKIRPNLPRAFADPRASPHPGTQRGTASRSVPSGPHDSTHIRADEATTPQRPHAIGRPDGGRPGGGPASPPGPGMARRALKPHGPPGAGVSLRAAGGPSFRAGRRAQPGRGERPRSCRSRRCGTR
jgi:hypothetical protein